MNYEFFIAKRIIKAKQYKSSVSATIIKIAIAAIAIGIVMMMVAIATGMGLQKTIQEKVAAFNGHIQISNFDNNDSEVSLTPLDSNQEFYPDFTQVSGIKHIQAVAIKAGIIRTEKTFEGVLAKGVGTDYNWEAFTDFLKEGRFPNVSDKRENREVLISAYLARRLELKLGDTFKSLFLKENTNEIPNERTFEIVGIYDSGFQKFDANVMLVDIRHIRRMNKWKAGEIGNFEVFLDSFDEIQLKDEEIYHVIPPNLDTQSVISKFPFIFEWISLFDVNIFLIIGIIIIVGGINMITALLVLILDRTPMIGILKSLGSSNWSIRKIFLYNAAYLIGIGLLWGNLIGIAFIWIQRSFGLLKFPNPEQYHTAIIPTHIEVWHILALNIGTLVLCVLMLLIPSYIITKITPVKAIKFQ
ncbi:Lipoprotein-releasing system transmembrane protein LolC [Kordia antarctica]|uniref:Lipoprotein-releasing system transmembrane protein LolC n=1 Tax=Kordia antarctica TaxID=1218801 RepID=A0A7L4ZIW5_9FLAO|nr:FtsX-like permease family protein [Kordia antarctica]QHI36441.1 Lipoprotein-releasing system transmembrane protein LolC [Kordia antarctica]